MRFDTAGSKAIIGERYVNDTLALAEGWNLVGALAYPLPAADIIADPGGIISSSFFGYSDHYFVSGTLQPGRGYWVKLSAPGKIILHHP